MTNMKKIIFILALLLTSILANAQSNYLNLSMGASIPLGDFKSTEDASTTGYAGTGFALNVEGKYFFIDYLGVAGTINYATNSTDEDALEASWLEYVKNLYPDYIIPPDANIQFNTSLWNTVSILVGPVLSFPFSRISFELKAQAGVSFITPPKRELYITYTNNEIYNNSGGHNTAFGYTLGAAFVFQANENYGLRIAADYFGSKAKLDLESSVDDGMGGSEIVTEVWEVPVTAINATVGIVYFF